MKRSRRGCGYCMDNRCTDYAKGAFLLNQGEHYVCPTCKTRGLVVDEVGSWEGDAMTFKEVRVEYNYDPVEFKYREVAIVRDDALEGIHNVYTLQSPLIKTDKRALKVAESLLANLQNYPQLVTNQDINEDGVPRMTEMSISLDVPMSEFKANLSLIQKSWEGLRQPNSEE